ncbi:MAG: hypothetical protein GEU28_14130 [Dehalococcoidia bacterium]|nr:hypothetical protein [Dehalococcoidia bacterium]
MSKLITLVGALFALVMVTGLGNGAETANAAGCRLVYVDWVRAFEVDTSRLGGGRDVGPNFIGRFGTMELDRNRDGLPDKWTDDGGGGVWRVKRPHFQGQHSLRLSGCLAGGNGAARMFRFKVEPSSPVRIYMKMLPTRFATANPNGCIRVSEIYSDLGNNFFRRFSQSYALSDFVGGRWSNVIRLSPNPGAVFLSLRIEHDLTCPEL